MTGIIPRCERMCNMDNVINFPMDGEGRKQALFDEAKEKLDAGLKEKLDRYGEVMKQAVHDALLEFCRQDEEFSEAVAQGGSFKDCMAQVAKGVKGSGISDMEAFGLAVKFFFPGAGIDVKMTINLSDSVEKEAATQKEQEKSEKRGPVMVSLNDFFKV